MAAAVVAVDAELVDDGGDAVLLVPVLAMSVPLMLLVVRVRLTTPPMPPTLLLASPLWCVPVARA